MVENTFGANIIEMLGNSFFMNSVIGNVATNEIQNLLQLYHNMKAGNNIKTEFRLNKSRFKYLSEYIAEPYIKNLVIRIIEELRQCHSNLH